MTPAAKKPRARHGWNDDDLWYAVKMIKSDMTDHRAAFVILRSIRDLGTVDDADEEA